MPKKKITKPRRRTPAQAFELSDLERMILVLYNAVPVAVRAAVGQALYHAWTQPATEAEGGLTAIRFGFAKKRFRVGAFGVNTLDDVQAGEPLDVGGGR